MPGLTKRASELVQRGKVFGIPKAQLQRLAKKIETQDKKDFEAFFRRNKKDISLGNFVDQPSAEKALRKNLRNTLSRSGFLTKDGEKIKTSELSLFGDIEFRPSKKNNFRIVERKKFIGDSPGEISELNFWKNKAPKKRKNNNPKTKTRKKSNNNVLSMDFDF